MFASGPDGTSGVLDGAGPNRRGAAPGARLDLTASRRDDPVSSLAARDAIAAVTTNFGELLRQGAPGLEDLLWILFLSPEFQLIR